jgi:archaellum component FlaD/FlaE
MVNAEEDSKRISSIDFDLKTELCNLVDQNILPKRIAERLEEKLKEKKLNINKDQLEMLVEKIREIIKKYLKNKQIMTKDEPAKTEYTPVPEKPKDENMQDLTDTIGKISERLTVIEKGKPIKGKVVTTDQIKFPKSMSRIDNVVTLDPLTEIPNDPECIIILMKWLQYLIDRCGHPNLSNILDYYVDIGWLSQDAKISIIDYSHGISKEKKDGQHSKENVTDLPSKDHIQSLIFIQKLKGNQFDKHFIDRIDSEISQIIRKIDNYRLK